MQAWRGRFAGFWTFAGSRSIIGGLANGAYVMSALPRILLVEDEWLIAEFFGDILREDGYEILGPAADLEAAQHLIEQENPKAAVLDVSLGNVKSYPIAELLTRHGIPFLFVSGYSADALLAEFRHVPLINKPMAGAQLAQAVRNLLEQ